MRSVGAGRQELCDEHSLGDVTRRQQKMPSRQGGQTALSPWGETEQAWGDQLLLPGVVVTRRSRIDLGRPKLGL